MLEKSDQIEILQLQFVESGPRCIKHVVDQIKGTSLQIGNPPVNPISYPADTPLL